MPKLRIPKVGYAAPNRALKEVATIVYTAPNRASDERSQKENQATLYAAPNRAPHGVSQKEKNKSLITKETRKNSKKIAYSYILKDLVWVYTWHITIRRHHVMGTVARAQGGEGHTWDITLMPHLGIARKAV